jgi:hypothetical protein
MSPMIRMDHSAFCEETYKENAGLPSKLKKEFELLTLPRAEHVPSQVRVVNNCK